MTPEPSCCPGGSPPSRIEQMFDQSVVAGLTREQKLAELRQALNAMPADRLDSPPAVLPVRGPLASVLPGGGLPRGGVVSMLGSASITTLLSALGAVSPCWSAIVGLPGLGMLAAAEFGVDFERTVMIPDAGSDVLQVLSVLADGMQVLVVGPHRWGAPARLRVLAGRLRQHGVVLLVAGPWPGAELVLQGRHDSWTGIGQGHGRLRERTLSVTVTGRRIGGERSVRMLLAGSHTSVEQRELSAARTTAPPAPPPTDRTTRTSRAG